MLDTKWILTKLILLIGICLTNSCVNTNENPNSQHTGNQNGERADSGNIYHPSFKGKKTDTKRGVEPEPVSDEPNLLQLSYVYRVNGKGEPKELNQNSVLHSGDTYKIIFELPKDSYVYIFQIDSANKISRLFPTKDFKGTTGKNHNPVNKGEKYFVPSENYSFKLDKQIGTEKIYFIATKNRNDNLEGEYKKMLTRQATNNFNDRNVAAKKLDKSVRTSIARGQAGIVKDVTQAKSSVSYNEGGEEFSISLKYLEQACDDKCGNILIFDHK